MLLFYLLMIALLPVLSLLAAIGAWRDGHRVLALAALAALAVSLFIAQQALAHL